MSKARDSELGATPPSPDSPSQAPSVQEVELKEDHDTFIESLPPIVDEKKVIRKIDMRIIPILSLLYLMSFLDRGSIGNANIEGLSVDLGLTGAQYNMCLTVFFFTYSVFEVPSNMMLKKLKPSIWLPTIMVAWGIVMTLMGIVQNYGGLLAARVFLGLTEAGLFPGVSYYLTLWYCRRDIQFRTAMFFSAASVAGAFSGLLAFAIAKMDGVGGLEGWRWIFILEGIATVVIAILAFKLVVDFPDTASFLNEQEREWVIWKLKYDTNKSKNAVQPPVLVEENHDTTWAEVRKAFKDPQLYPQTLLYAAVLVPLYGVSLFLPTIVKNLGYTSSKAQLMTIPIYTVAAIASVLQAWVSDKFGLRSPLLVVNFCCMFIGYMLAMNVSAVDNPSATYAGCYLVALGLYPGIPGIISWLSNNTSGAYKRGVSMGVQIGFGNLCGAIASQIYRAEDAPQFKLGHGIEVMFICLGFICIFVLNIGYYIVNKRKRRMIAKGQCGHYTAAELSQMGDKSPYFIYAH
ncbi:major facilitator superfamily domain-containing protein [Yarrowia lipolytica]|uniref:Major facilitator superfamily domain-containing protein n=1 Tax=Yarrowia lipolytica TaxID=4952 RepID=A0A371BXI9_YARLL|nr:major facilitator superfamily domain-containing protein [Yarrowia lipolytica]